MADRKPLPKSLRYEILKRDSFTCQYCGRMAPDVILEVDHIIPVAEGGENEIFNLITSCRDCNRGKGATRLDDQTMINKQKQALKDQNEMREQIEMMIKWKEELREMTEWQVKALSEHWSYLTDDEYYLKEGGIRTLKDHLKRFGFQEVYEAMEIAIDRYYFSGPRDIEFAWQKVGGICYNRRNQRKQQENE